MWAAFLAGIRCLEVQVDVKGNIAFQLRMNNNSRAPCQLHPRGDGSQSHEKNVAKSMKSKTLASPKE